MKIRAKVPALDGVTASVGVVSALGVINLSTTEWLSVPRHIGEAVVAMAPSIIETRYTLAERALRWIGR